MVLADNSNDRSCAGERIVTAGPNRKRCKGMEAMEVGFLGTGRMGKAMAANLLKAGHRVRAWDKSREPLRELERAGAEIAADAADAFRGDAVIAMLPNDQALREVFIAGDLLGHGRPSTVSVNMGTV